MADRRVRVVFGVEDTGMINTLQQMKKQIQLTNSELQLASQKVNTYGKSIQNLTEKKKALTTQIQNVKRQMELYNQNIENNSKKYEENKNKLTELTEKKKQLKEQIKEAEKQYGKESEEVSKLKEEMKTLNSEITDTKSKMDSNSNTITNYSKKLNDAEKNLTRLEGQLRETNEEIAKQSSGFIKAGEYMQKLGTNLNTLGSKMQTVGGVTTALGDKLMMLSSVFVGLSTYAIKVGMDFEAGMSEVQAISGATGEDLKLLTEKAKEMGATTKFSATESAEAMKYMAMAGWKTEDMLNGLEGVMYLAAASGEQLGTVSDIVTDALTAFGLKASDSAHFSDVLAAASTNSNTNVGLMGTTFQYVAPIAGSLGFSIEQVAEQIGLLANASIKGDKAGTGLRTILNAMASDLKFVNNAGEEFVVTTTNADGSMRNLNDIINDSRAIFNNFTEAEKSLNAEATFSKTAMASWLVLMNSAPEDVSKLENAINNCSGATKDMSEIMIDNTKGNLTIFKSQLEGLGIQLSEHLLPHVNSLIGKLSEFVSWFGSLDKETQKLILKTGLLTFASGGLLKVAGSLITGAGKLVTGLGSLSTSIGKIYTKIGNLAVKSSGASAILGKLTATFGTLGGAIIPVVATIGTLAGVIYGTHEYMEAMNRSAIKSRDEMSTLEKIFVDLSGGVSYTKKELEDMGLVQKDLSDNLSKDFKKAVKDSTKDVQEFAFNLHTLNIDNVLTNDECNELNDRVNKLCESAISAIEEKQQEIQSTLQEGFNADGVIDNTEQTLINFYNESGDKNKAEVTRMQKEVNEIFRKVREEGYKVTPNDEALINEYYAKISQIQLEAQAKNNEYELNYARNEFKARLKNVDAETASELLQQKAKQYEDEKAQTDAHYQTMIDTIMSNYNEMNGSQKAQADTEKARLTKEWEEKKQINEQNYRDDLNYFKIHNENLLDVIDVTTGKILEKEDLRANERLNTMIKNYEGMDKVTESGMYKFYSTNDKAWHNVQVVVDETTGQIVEAVATSTDAQGVHMEEAAGYNEKFAKSAQDMATEYTSAQTRIKNAVTDGKNTTVNANGEIINSNGQVVGSLSEVKTATDGTRVGIININNTPIQIRVNKDGTIANVNEIKDALDRAAKDRTSTIWVQYKGTGDYFSDGRGNVWVNGNKVSSQYATGTSNSKEGLALTNEDGWELHDSITSIARSIGNSLSYLPSGTKVTNHLASTQKMREDIRREVARQNKNTNSNNISNSFYVTNEIVVKGNLDNVTKADLQKQLSVNNKKFENDIIKSFKKEFNKY